MGYERIERRLDVPGGQVWSLEVRRAGPASGEPSGLPLVLLHGGPGAPHHYLRPLEALAGERPVFFYDQLGCGESERPDDMSLWTVERAVDELKAVRAALGLERFHLAGQSWGTALAVRYAATVLDPGVASLVLSGPFLDSARWQADQRAHLAALPPEIQQVVADAEASGEFESEAYQEAMMAFYARHVCRLDPWPECLDEAFGKMGLDVYLTMWGPSEFTCTGLLKDADFTGLLQNIQVPVLWTCGRHDEATPETTAWYRSLLPGSEMHVFEEASHSHHLEKADEYLSVVADFLRRHDEAGATSAAGAVRRD